MNRRIIQASFIVGYVFFLFWVNVFLAHAEDDDIIIGTYYQLDGNEEGYNYSDSQKSYNMDYGYRSLGDLHIKSDDHEKSGEPYNGYTAYGVLKGKTYLSYYGIHLKNPSENEWHVVTDESTKIGDFTISGSVGKGTIVVQKYNGRNWINIAIDTNFFENYSAGKDDFYSLSGEDVGAGQYYKIIVAYKTGRKKPGFFEEYEYKKHIEIYQFYVCKNDAIINVHNLTTEENGFADSYDAGTIELLSKGESLKDGAITKDGFTIQKISSANEVRVNGVVVQDGSRFTKNGKYKIDVCTPLGKKNSMTVYVFNGGNDNGISIYFSDRNIVTGKKVYFADKNIPSYEIGAKIDINRLPDDVPILKGKIKNIDTGTEETLKEWNRNPRSYSFGLGEYYVDLYCGDFTNGCVYQYVLHFYVVDEESVPSINYLCLLERQYNLMTEHYEVIWNTTGGGQLRICFENADDAYEYAYDIQKRFIEYVDNNEYRYGELNKEKYYINRTSDRIRLTRDIAKDSKKHVAKSYFVQSDPFTFRTVKESDLKSIDGGNMGLEDVSFRETIHLFPTEEEKNKFYNDKIVLNNYKFIKAEDYEVNKVEATLKGTQEKIDIVFNVPVDEQLKISGEYLVTETNIYGNKKEYSAWYYNNNESHLNYSNYMNGEVIKGEVSCSNKPGSIKGEAFLIDSITNPFDDNALIIIDKLDKDYDDAPELICRIGQIHKLILYEKGDYLVKMVDTVGNTIGFELVLDGKDSIVMEDDWTVYSELYTSIYE